MKGMGGFVLGAVVGAAAAWFLLTQTGSKVPGTLTTRSPSTAVQAEGYFHNLPGVPPVPAPQTRPVSYTREVDGFCGMGAAAAGTVWSY